MGREESGKSDAKEVEEKCFKKESMISNDTQRTVRLEKNSVKYCREQCFSKLAAH